MWYFIIQLILHLYNILGLFVWKSLKLVDSIFIEQSRVEVQQVCLLRGALIMVHYGRCVGDIYLNSESVWTLKVWAHSQENVYAQKEESFHFLHALSNGALALT